MKQELMATAISLSGTIFGTDGQIGRGGATRGAARMKIEGSVPTGLHG